MRIKIGRFEAYVPDKDPFDVILQMLSLAYKSGDEFNSPPHQLHKFFYELKAEFSDELEDVFFNHDPDFPFSEEISNSFTRLQESGYVTRPNPSFYRYLIDGDLSDKMPDSTQEYFPKIATMARKFKEEFGPK